MMSARSEISGFLLFLALMTYIHCKTKLTSNCQMITSCTNMVQKVLFHTASSANDYHLIELLLLSCILVSADLSNNIENASTHVIVKYQFTFQ